MPLFRDNPQTYPHLLWISGRPAAAEPRVKLPLTSRLAKVRAQKMLFPSKG
jgi:hypothetical protein